MGWAFVQGVSHRLMRRRRLIIHLRASLWFVPVLCVLAGAAISFVTIALDRAFSYKALPRSVVGGPDAATAVLSTVAASMVSLTALVLTITMVVVQLAMGQFSPRIVQRILRDKPSQLAIGLFVATFVHAILALREVTNNGDGTGHVPGIAVMTAFLLVLASIAVLVIYVQHIGQALRVSALIELVGKDTRRYLIACIQTKARLSRRAQRTAARAIHEVRCGHGDRLGQLVEEARAPTARWNSSPRSGNSCRRTHCCSGCSESR